MEKTKKTLQDLKIEELEKQIQDLKIENFEIVKQLQRQLRNLYNHNGVLRDKIIRLKREKVLMQTR